MFSAILPLALLAARAFGEEDCFDQWVHGYSDEGLLNQNGPAQVGKLLEGIPTALDCQKECQKSSDCVRFVWRKISVGSFKQGACLLKSKAIVKNAINIKPTSGDPIDTKYCNFGMSVACVDLYNCKSCDGEKRCIWESYNHIAGPRYCGDKSKVCKISKPTTAFPVTTTTTPKPTEPAPVTTKPTEWSPSTTTTPKPATSPEENTDDPAGVFPEPEVDPEFPEPEAPESTPAPKPTTPTPKPTTPEAELTTPGAELTTPGAELTTPEAITEEENTVIPGPGTTEDGNLPATAIQPLPEVPCVRPPNPPCKRPCPGPCHQKPCCCGGSESHVEVHVEVSA